MAETGAGGSVGIDGVELSGLLAVFAAGALPKLKGEGAAGEVDIMVLKQAVRVRGGRRGGGG